MLRGENKHPQTLYLCLLAVGGMMTALTLIFPQIGLLEWVTLVPSALAIFGITDNPSIKLRKAYGYGFAFLMSFFLVIYHWFIYLYPLEFTGMNKPSAVAVVLAGWVGLSLLQAVSGALILVGAVALGRSRICRRFGIVLPFAVGGMWVIFEYAQTFFWWGVPWARLAIGQTASPIMFGSVSFFGSYFITFLIVSANFLVAYAIYNLKSTARRYAAALCALLCLGSNLALGGLSMARNNNQNDVKSIGAAVVQGNIASSMKWNLSLYDVIDIYADYTRQAAAEGAELVIWPETAVTSYLGVNENVTEILTSLAVECDVDIVVGMFSADGQDREYNSLAMFRSDGTVAPEIYSKRHLVPFGEYMPMRKIISTLIPPLAEIAMLEEDLTPGADSGIMYHNGIPLGSLICFDSIYEELTRESVGDGAKIILLSTNDSWFFDSAAVYMHFGQAKLRAAEVGRPILRAANTGISAIITPNGEVTEYLEPLVGGYLVAQVTPSATVTPYSVIGNLFVYLIIIFVSFMLAMCTIHFFLDRKICSSR